jgi:serine protease Do
MATRTRVALTSLAVLVVALGAAASIEAWIPAASRPTDPPAATDHFVANSEAVRQAEELSEAFVAIAASVTPAVVRIQTEHGMPGEGWLSRGLQDFFGSPRSDDPEAERPPQVAGGTGFIVSADGFILTNNHVVQDADRITVALADKRTFDAHIVGRDPTTDLAVIRIRSDGALPAVRLGDSDRARVGQWVLAVGNPGFQDASTLDFTVTSGIISAKGRPLNILASGLALESPDEAGFAIEDFIQTDAVINPGNSGGPLVDLDGSVIGINTAIASSTGYSQGYGFAIPSNLARDVMRDLIEHGQVRRALLGVSISNVSAEDAEVYGLPSISGVLVEDFGVDSPARLSGLERHDVIVAVDGTPVDRVGQLQRLIAQHDPGEAVQLDVVRYGVPRAFTISLAEAPITAVPTETRLVSRRAMPSGLGIELADLTSAVARRYGIAETGGVVVTQVAPYGAADRKGVVEGLRVLSVDRAPTGSARNVRSALRRAQSGQVVSLLLQTPDGRTSIVNIRVP